MEYAKTIKTCFLHLRSHALALLLSLFVSSVVNGMETVGQVLVPGTYTKLHTFTRLGLEVGRVLYTTSDGYSGATPVIKYSGRLYAVAGKDTAGELIDGFNGLHSFLNEHFLVIDGSGPGSGLTRTFLLLSITPDGLTLRDVQHGIAENSVAAPIWARPKSMRSLSAVFLKETDFPGDLSLNAQGELGIWVVRGKESRLMPSNYHFEQFLAISQNGFAWTVDQRDFERYRAVAIEEHLGHFTVDIYSALSRIAGSERILSKRTAECDLSESLADMQKGLCKQFWNLVASVATDSTALAIRRDLKEYRLVNLVLTK